MYENAPLSILYIVWYNTEWSCAITHLSIHGHSKGPLGESWERLERLEKGTKPQSPLDLSPDHPLYPIKTPIRTPSSQELPGTARMRSPVKRITHNLNILAGPARRSSRRLTTEFEYCTGCTVQYISNSTYAPETSSKTVHYSSYAHLQFRSIMARRFCSPRRTVFH